jgi:hypothetical protein
MSSDHRVLPSSQSRWHYQVENGNRAGANDFASEPSSPLPATWSRQPFYYYFSSTTETCSPIKQQQAVGEYGLMLAWLEPRR